MNTSGIPVELISGAALTAFAWLVKVLITVARDARAQKMFLAVTQAGVVATAHAMGQMRKSLEAAQGEASPGGKAITATEARAAMESAVKVGFAYLESRDLLGLAIKVFGGEQAITDAIVGKMETSLREKGYPVGQPQE